MINNLPSKIKKMIIRRKISSPTEHIVEWLFCKKKKYSFLNCKWAIPPPDQNKKKKMKNETFFMMQLQIETKKNHTFLVYLAFLFVTLYNNIHVNKTNRYFQKANNYMLWILTQTEYFLLPGRIFSSFFSFYTSTGFPCQKWCMSCHSLIFS